MAGGNALRSIRDILIRIRFTVAMSTYPLVAKPVKVAALEAYRDVERGVVT